MVGSSRGADDDRQTRRGGIDGGDPQEFEPTTGAAHLVRRVRRCIADLGVPEVQEEMTPERLRYLIDKATPGPWKHSLKNMPTWVWAYGNDGDPDVGYSGIEPSIDAGSVEDAELITALYGWAPKAIAALSVCSAVLENVGCSCYVVSEKRVMCLRCTAIVSLDKAMKETP